MKNKIFGLISTFFIIIDLGIFGRSMFLIMLMVVFIGTLKCKKVLYFDEMNVGEVRMLDTLQTSVV